MMDLRGKRVLVVGLAQTGISVARLAARRGARVVVNDGKPEEALGERLAALEAAVAEGGGAEAVDALELVLGGHPEAAFTGADLVVMSPGVPELPAMAAARAAGVEVIAEIELAYRLLDPGRPPHRHHRHQRQVDHHRAEPARCARPAAGPASAAATSATTR